MIWLYWIANYSIDIDIPDRLYFNFKVVFTFKFFNLYAKPASLGEAHASGRRTSRLASALAGRALWHAHPEEHRPSRTWGTARAALRGGRAREHCYSGMWGTI
jgi:hypothetical protein